MLVKQLDAGLGHISLLETARVSRSPDNQFGPDLVRLTGANYHKEGEWLIQTRHGRKVAGLNLGTGKFFSAYKFSIKDFYILKSA